MLRTGYRFLIFLLFLYTGLIFLPYFFCKGSVSSFMSTWVAVVGGSILLWYTWETLLIRKIANSQRELSIQPLVVFKNSHGKYEI